jgi:phosphoribosylaminoimidazolecarboxamide formyltransferase/IMP cyclohydrolase
MLVQERDMKLPLPDEWIHAAGPAPGGDTLRDAAIMWLIVKHLKSNAIAIGVDGQILGAGMGLVDRVTACRVAVSKAGDRIATSPRPVVAASDAFFPFADGPRILIDAGVKCIIQPGGSKRDQDTIELCDKHNITCMVTKVRHFRH